MRRMVACLLLALTWTAACGRDAAPEPRLDAPPGFEPRIHAATLVEQEAYAYLEVDGLGSLDGKVADPAAALAQRVVGTWGTAYATEDYPSSYIHATVLELGDGGQAAYREEEGSEHLDADGKIHTSMHTSKGPWEGTWTVAGKRAIEITLFVPRADR